VHRLLESRLYTSWAAMNLLYDVLFLYLCFPYIEFTTVTELFNLVTCSSRSIDITIRIPRYLRSKCDFGLDTAMKTTNTTEAGGKYSPLVSQFIVNYHDANAICFLCPHPQRHSPYFDIIHAEISPSTP